MVTSLLVTSRLVRFRILPCGIFLLVTSVVSGLAGIAQADTLIVTDRMHHLRSGDDREWSTFPDQAEARELRLSFDARATSSVSCLELRHDDVRQDWRVTINDQEVAALQRDENDMRVYFNLPAETLKVGANLLVVRCQSDRTSDDVRIGDIRIHAADRATVLSESTLNISVTSSVGRSDAAESIPCRITVLDDRGALQELLATPERELAVRPGTVYSASGRAKLQLPAGKYRVLAGRGFEYSLASVETQTGADQEAAINLRIQRVVPTDGYVACDTHVHTLTHSGHGDSTVLERMITLAGEGIELPIATDHNVQIDHEPFAREAGVRRWFTPVVGNEVTTKQAHFNVFPAKSGGPLPDHRGESWAETFRQIDAVPDTKVVILNHARDLHSGVRPFGPALFNDASGVNVRGWNMRANAMEVVNSSANQTDILQLFHDWMTMLNRGHVITPVGSSDSHDVLRHFVGQGRTYIRCHDADPGNIDVEAAVASFLQGRVLVSFGLLTELTVDGKYGSGEVARPVGDHIHLRVTVSRPEWIQADRIRLYANGELIVDDAIAWDAADSGGPASTDDEQPHLPTDSIDPADRHPNVRAYDWSIPRPRHDVHLVAIATGPGLTDPWWRTAKPYQPDSPDWNPQVLGCSGAVWVDNDQDGRPTSAYDYARSVVTNDTELNAASLRSVIEQLENFDAATAIQAANLLDFNTGEIQKLLLEPAIARQLEKSAPHIAIGFERYIAAWRRTVIAQ